MRKRLRAIGAAALFVVVSRGADAQLVSAPAAPPPPWPAIEVLATPYIWMPWSSITVRPADTRVPSTSTTIDPGLLYGHLTWVPFMGEAEFRNGPFGVVVDYIHAPLKSGVSTHNILFNGATSGLTIDSGTAMFLYRPFVEPDQYADVGMGVSAWGLDGSINLNEGLLPAFNATNGLSWADPMIAARYHRDLGNGFSATAYGDLGGFGVGAHFDWQLIGTIDYAAALWIDLHVGFRSLNFSYGAPRANFTFNLNGPILAATFRF